MFSQVDYRGDAKIHETAFRIILSHFREGISELFYIDDIYEKYSTGERRAKWTIYNFYQLEPGKYFFSYGDVAPLSGYQKCGVFTIKGGKVVNIDYTAGRRF